MPFVLELSRKVAHLCEHIFNEYSIPHGRVVDEDMGDGADQLAVLNDRRAAHECGQVGTTVFYK